MISFFPVHAIPEKVYGCSKSMALLSQLQSAPVLSLRTARHSSGNPPQMAAAVFLIILACADCFGRSKAKQMRSTCVCGM